MSYEKSYSNHDELTKLILGKCNKSKRESSDLVLAFWRAGFCSTVIVDLVEKFKGDE